MSGGSIELAGPTGNTTAVARATYLDHVNVVIDRSAIRVTGAAVVVFPRPNASNATVVSSVSLEVLGSVVTSTTSPAVSVVSTAAANSAVFSGISITISQSTVLAAGTGTAAVGGIVAVVNASITIRDVAIAAICSTIRSTQAAAVVAVAAAVFRSSQGSSVTVTAVKIGVLGSNASAATSTSVASVGGLVHYGTSMSNTGIVSLESLSLLMHLSNASVSANGATSDLLALVSVAGWASTSFDVSLKSSSFRIELSSVNATAVVYATTSLGAGAVTGTVALAGSATALGAMTSVGSIFSIIGSAVFASATAYRSGSQTFPFVVLSSSSCASVATANGTARFVNGTLRAANSTLNCSSLAQVASSANNDLSNAGSSSAAVSGVSSGRGHIIVGNTTHVIESSRIRCLSNASIPAGHAVASDSAIAIGVVTSGGGITTLTPTGGGEPVQIAWNNNAVGCAWGTYSNSCAAVNPASEFVPRDETSLGFTNGLVPLPFLDLDLMGTAFTNGIRTSASWCAVLPTLTAARTWTHTLADTETGTFEETATSTASPSSSPTVTPSTSSTPTTTDTISSTDTLTETPSSTLSVSMDPTVSASRSRASLSESSNDTQTKSGFTMTRSPSFSSTITSTVSRTQLRTFTSTARVSPSSTQRSPTATRTLRTPTLSKSITRRPSLTDTLIPSPSQTHSRTIQLRYETLPPSAITGDTATVTQGVLTTGTAVVAGATSPGAALQASRAMAVLWLSQCNGDSNALVPFPLSLWPGFRIAPNDAGSFLRGAVVSVLATLIALLALGLWVVIIYAKCTTKTFHSAAKTLKFPGIFSNYFGLTLDGLVSCAVGAFLHGEARMIDTPLFVIAFVYVGASMVMSVWVNWLMAPIACDVVQRRDEGYDPFSEEQDTKKATFMQRLDEKLHGRWMWQPKDHFDERVVQTSPWARGWFVEPNIFYGMMGNLFAKYHSSGRLFYSVDIALTLFVSAAKGSMPNTVSTCLTVTILVTVACAVALAVAVVQRPYLSPVKNVLLITTSGLTVVGAIAICLAMKFSSSALLSVGQICVTISGYISLGNFAITLHKEIRSRREQLQRRLAKSREGGQGGPVPHHQYIAGLDEALLHDSGDDKEMQDLLLFEPATNSAPPQPPVALDPFAQLDGDAAPPTVIQSVPIKTHRERALEEAIALL